MPDGSLASESLDAVLARVAGPAAGPGGGSAAAIACALSAALVEMAARHDESVMATARLARAEALRARSLELAEREVTAYDPVLEAEAMQLDNPQRETRLAAARAQAAISPLTIAGIGSQLTALAAESAVAGPDALVGEAVVAAELADAACRAAAHLVRLDLQDSPNDPRRREVTGHVNSAAEALEQAFGRAAELATASSG